MTTIDIQTLLDSGIYRRTRLFVLLYAYQGVRAAEIAAIAGEAIDRQRQRILSVDGKGGKEVWRPIHPLVWEELQKWTNRGHLFPSPIRPGEHITPNNVSAVLSAAMKRAGIAHRPHQMRAWFATELIRSGTSTVVVAAAMRHSDLQSVTKYALVDSRAIASAMDALPVVTVPTRSGRQRARA